jgi:hypothetical protein
MAQQPDPVLVSMLGDERKAQCWLVGKMPSAYLRYREPFAGSHSHAVSGASLRRVVADVHCLEKLALPVR